MCGQGQEVVTCDPTPKVGIGSQASKRLHLPRKKEVGSQAIMGPGSRRNFSGTSRRHRKYSPATQGSRVTENFSEASKILHLPHKVSVCHLRLFPTSKYTVRGQHLGGIEIVAPATQNPWQGSQIVYRVTSDPNVGRVTQLVDVWAGPGSSHLRPYPKGR